MLHANVTLLKRGVAPMTAEGFGRRHDGEEYLCDGLAASIEPTIGRASTLAVPRRATLTDTI